ncbi:MAG: hypothetical protein JJU35_15370, partial [Balneolales bacterium]|nr:hypothetical protein [Balneolales bacterium]
MESLRKVASIKNKIDRVKFELEQAESDANYEEASRLKYAVLPNLEKELSEFQDTWILGRVNIAQVIARQTGIPVEKILKTKQDNILELEKFLKANVYGQEDAIHEIS